MQLGGFHIICNLLNVIEKRFEDAGLEDLLVESGVIASGSVCAALKTVIINTIEMTISKGTQTAGGTKGFSLDFNAIGKYYLTSDYHSDCMRQLRSSISTSVRFATPRPYNVWNKA